VKETTMGWMNRFRGSGRAEPADPWNATVINGAPYAAYKANRTSSEDPAAPDRPDAHIAEEIKRRQIALAVRYVAALRAR
jgi:hypothetical protein